MFTHNGFLQRGISLIELIVFIIVVGVAVAGVLAALNMSTRASADPMIRKQALAIAEAVLEEIQLQPFTYCDPDDPAAPTASGVADCATQEAIGAEAGETRYSTVTPYDNVNDYHGFDSSTATPTGIRSLDGGSVDGLEGYRVTVSVAGQALGPGATPPINIPAAESLLMAVTVTGPGETTVVLHGYRTRYAPNALP